MGTKVTMERVNSVLDVMEKILADIKKNQDVQINTEKDRMSYKEGLVDGLVMTSWQKDEVDYVGKADNEGNGIKLSDYLDEIGSVYGFDGEAELLRVKCTDEDGLVKGSLKEVVDNHTGCGEDNFDDMKIEHTDCNTCGAEGLVPRHNGSKNCESGSIASGGDKSHCSCDICF